MKRFTILSLVMAALLIVGVGNAFAWGGKCYYNCKPTPGPDTATLNISGNSFASDYEIDYSGYGNDFAEAGATGGMTFEMDLYANGKTLCFFGQHPVNVQGSFESESNVDLYTAAWDYGRGSGAYAKAQIEDSWASGFGTAYGYKGLKETASGSIGFEGSLFEQTSAKEEGYSAGEIIGGQHATVEFTTLPKEMCSINILGLRTVFGSRSGDFAEVKGKTEVEIDPYGSHKSIEGNTWTKVNAPGDVTANFAGGVGGFITNGPAGVGGGASYDVTNGSGNYQSGSANFNALIGVHGSRTHVTVSGSATANSSPCGSGGCF